MDIAQMLSVVFVHSLIKARVQVSWLLGHKTGILAQYSNRRPQKHRYGKVEQCTLWSYSIGSFEFELFCENIPGVVMWPMKRTWPITCFTDFNWLKGLIFPVETSEFHKNSMTRDNPAFVYSNKNVYWTLSNLMVNWYRKKWPHILDSSQQIFFHLLPPERFNGNYQNPHIYCPLLEVFFCSANIRFSGAYRFLEYVLSCY